MAVDIEGYVTLGIKADFSFSVLEHGLITAILAAILDFTEN